MKTAVQERSRKTEQALLNALERLLDSKSMADLTVAEIASEAGLTTGAIYRRFRDKNDLLHAAFDRFLERTEEGNLAFDTETTVLSDRQHIELAIRDTVHFTYDHIPLMRAASLLDDAVSFDRMRTARNIISDSLAEHISASQYSGGELKRRVRFTLRTVTAVARDTFLAGPGARFLTLSGKSAKVESDRMLDHLVSDLVEQAMAYLQITSHKE